MFHSEVKELGSVQFPAFGGQGVMMMPFRLEDVKGTIPAHLSDWTHILQEMVNMAPVKEGVAYVTIDEACVKAGAHHRRPGLHVDGKGPGDSPGAWGGGGSWASSGMLVAASKVGCRAFRQGFQGNPGPNGDCGHLAEECLPEAEVLMEANRVYWCGSLTVHETLAQPVDTARQFIRVSMPNDAPWYEGYTRNPLGVEPTGPIHPPRSAFMAYRSTHGDA